MKQGNRQRLHEVVCRVEENQHLYQCSRCENFHTHGSVKLITTGIWELGIYGLMVGAAMAK